MKRMTRNFWKKLLCLTLTAMLIVLALPVLAEETDTEEVQYQAYASVALKVRREPRKDSSGKGSIPKDSLVSILELMDSGWARVVFGEGDGYVQTQYLQAMTSMDGSPIEPQPTPEPGVPDESGFREAYQAYALNQAAVYAEASEDSSVLVWVPMYKEVIVSEVDGDWCRARYNGKTGYMLCDSLFKWDRLVWDAGEIPGLDIMPLMVFTNKSTDIVSADGSEVFQTVNPGAAFCAYEKDETGRYGVPYHRTKGYVSEEDIAYVMPVVDWENAQPGDLISVMTTFYAVGVYSLQYQGRNWNIHLASGLISGIVLQPGETYDQNQVIGPYRKSTGYKSAPIMSKNATSGYGGGTCQVNTTFYAATIQVPILVTHRRVHADVGIYYIKQGFDAAVGGGNINLTLENTLPYAIRYQFFDCDGVLTCCIFRA